MDNRPIGVFDSGLGGLTCVKELTRLMPEEDIVYFGDTARIPYGTRSRETIIKYTRQDIRFLMQSDVKLIVLACGTASSTALEEVQNDYGVTILGVVKSAAMKAVKSTKLGRIGLIGTDATVRSGSYERQIAALSPDIRVTAQACPLLVPLVENGRIHPGDIVAETVVAEYLEPVRTAGVDTLILGCTHYPLLSRVIANYMGPEVRLIDPGYETAAYTKKLLTERDTRTEPKTGNCRYYVSDSVESFIRYGGAFLNREIRGGVERVSVDEY